MTTMVSADNQWKMPESQKLAEGSTHFYGWKKQTTIFLTSTGLMSIVDGTETKPSPDSSPADEVALWASRDNRAKAQLSSYITLGLLSQLDIDSANAMWKSINSRFHMTGAAAMAIAHKALLNKQIGHSETMQKHIEDLRKLRTDYYNSGGTLDEVEWKIIILNSLKYKWESYRPSFLTIDNPEKIVNLLLLEAKTVASNGSNTGETALATRVKDKRVGPDCTHCG